MNSPTEKKPETAVSFTAQDNMVGEWELIPLITDENTNEVIDPEGR